MPGFSLVEIRGFKPRTSALPALRSNQLSYIPNKLIVYIKLTEKKVLLTQNRTQDMFPKFIKPWYFV